MVWGGFGVGLVFEFWLLCSFVMGVGGVVLWLDLVVVFRFWGYGVILVLVCVVEFALLGCGLVIAFI